jgi:MFS family permease
VLAPTVTPLARAASQRLRSTFAALQYRNFRLFLIGQFISLCGTWIQQVALGWLVLELTNSPFAVGLVSTLGSLPILFFTLYGGVVADRVDKRRFVIVLQALMLCEALTLGILTAFHWANVTWVMALAIFAGFLSAFEVPARQALIVELVGREDLMNAIALNSSAFNVARVIGPAIAGILIAGFGMAACFFTNAASYVAVLVGLVKMETKPRPVQKEIGAVTAMAEGLQFTWSHRWPRALVVLIAGFSLFGFPFMTMLPVYTRDVLHLGPSGYAAQLTAIGVGAAIAALSLAGFGQRSRPGRLLLGGSLLFGLSLAAAALFPNRWAAFGLFTLAGWTMALNGILSNTMLQTEAPDHLRGRVMGVYSFLVLGLAPFGSLQAGFVSEHLGVRWSIGLGGLVCALVAAGVATYMAGGPERLYRAARQSVA